MTAACGDRKVWPPARVKWESRSSSSSSSSRELGYEHRCLIDRLIVEVSVFVLSSEIDSIVVEVVICDTAMIYLSFVLSLSSIQDGLSD